MPITDLVYDVGMHRGEDTAYYLAKGFSVVAFEANPDLVSAGRKRFSNEIADGRMELIEGAIADTNARSVTFHRHPRETVWGTIDPAWASRNDAMGESVPIEVPVVQFAEVLRTKGVPWYLKVDIEGVDRHCLDALRSTAERPAFVSLESEKSDWEALVGEFDLLESLGYDRFAVRQQKHLRRQISTITTRDGRREPFEFASGSSGPFGDDVVGWMTRDQALEAYRRIFRWYRLIGDGTLVGRGSGWKLLKALEGAIRQPLPGWYDTHASTRAVVGA